MPRPKKPRVVKDRSATARTAIDENQEYSIRDLPCSFSNANVGETCAIGVTVDRANIDYKKLAPLIVSARVAVLIEVDPQADGDVEGQAKFIDTSAVSLHATADCPSLAIKEKTLGFRLVFGADSDVRETIKIAKHNGRISIARLGDRGGDSADDKGEE